MKTVSIIKSGKRTDGSFYALCKKVDQGFILKGFVQTEAQLEEGEVEIPSAIEQRIEWKA